MEIFRFPRTPGDRSSDSAFRSSLQKRGIWRRILKSLKCLFLVIIFYEAVGVVGCLVPIISKDQNLLWFQKVNTGNRFAKKALLILLPIRQIGLHGFTSRICGHQSVIHHCSPNRGRYARTSGHSFVAFKQHVWLNVSEIKCKPNTGHCKKSQNIPRTFLKTAFRLYNSFKMKRCVLQNPTVRRSSYGVQMAESDFLVIYIHLHSQCIIWCRDSVAANPQVCTVYIRAKI